MKFTVEQVDPFGAHWTRSKNTSITFHQVIA